MDTNSEKSYDINHDYLANSKKHLVVIQKMRAWREKRQEFRGIDNSRIRAEVGALKHAERLLANEIKQLRLKLGIGEKDGEG